MKKTTKQEFNILPSSLRDEIGKRIEVLQKVLYEAENIYPSFI